MPYQTFLNLPEHKRVQVIQAAIDEFYEKGYEKTSIAQIIGKAGIPRGSFYQYFEDKNDLYRYIIIEIIGEKKHQAASNNLVESQSIFEILRELFISGIEFYRQYPKLGAIAADFIKLKDKDLSAKILGDSQKMSNLYFKRLIDQGKSLGEIVEDVDTEMLIYLINTLNSTFVDYFIDKAHLDYMDHELFNAVDRMLLILQNGIKKR